MKPKRKELLSLYSSDFQDYIKELRDKNPNFFNVQGFRSALKTFRQAVKRVPAYKDFLRKNSINPNKINTFEDFQSLPVTNKEYLKSYKLDEICWDGKLSNLNMISTSSGSTGDPFYWPRGLEQEAEVTKIYELVYKTFKADEKKTLVVIGYSMGNWVAGTFTLTATMRLAQKGYPITIISPGIIIEEIVKAIKNLSSNFDQIILAGYPPFIKDVIDHGRNSGIKWEKLEVKFIWGGEVISEQFRDYILKAVGKTREVERLTDTMNTYGSADAAMLGFETPVSIYLRRQGIKNKKLQLDLFKSNRRLPTLVQYDPRFKFFEVVSNRLVFTSSSGIPLIRYDIGDSGSLISHELFLALSRKYKFNVDKDFKRMGISNLNWKLPFLYLFGRRDLTVTLYGLNVYPENVKAALESKELSRYLTGKFTMSTEETARHNQFLLINFELAEKAKNGDHLHREVVKIVVEKLKELNSEYSKLYSSIGKKAVPKINLIKYGDPKYFKIKIKQRWVAE